MLLPRLQYASRVPLPVLNVLFADQKFLTGFLPLLKVWFLYNIIQQTDYAGFRITNVFPWFVCRWSSLPACYFPEMAGAILSLVQVYVIHNFVYYCENDNRYRSLVKSCSLAFEIMGRKHCQIWVKLVKCIEITVQKIQYVSVVSISWILMSY